MKSMMKEIMMKRREKFKPKDDGELGMLHMDSDEENEKGMYSSEDPDLASDEEMSEDEQKPGTITISVKSDEGKDDEEKDIAPGKPANPVDEKASKEAAHSELIDAIMGGLSEDEIMAKKGKLSLIDRIKQGAVKSKQS